MALPCASSLGFLEPHGSHQMGQMWRVPLCQLLEQLHALLLPVAIPGPQPVLSCSCVNSTDSEDGCTPLHLACRKGDMECLLELLECQARVDITDRNGETVFHYAVRGNNPQIIEVGESGTRMGLLNAVTEVGKQLQTEEVSSLC